MRKRDERFNDQGKHRAKEDPLYDKRAAGQTKVIKRFAPQDFKFRGDNTATCSAGKTLKSTGTRHTTAAGLRYQLYAADATDCQTCTLRSKCLRRPGSERGRQVTRFEPKAINPSDPSERTKRAIDLERGRRLYSQRMGTVEPMFGTLRHND